MRGSDHMNELAAALAAAQAEFPIIEKGRSARIVGTKHSYTYDYADLSDVLAAIQPVLAKHGLAVLQPPSNGPDGAVMVTTRVLHVSGQWIEEDFVLAAVDPRDARSMGSAVTYARRYGLTGMLGIAPADGEDDDGAAARGGDHEMPAARPSSKLCPTCGADAIIQGKAEWGGGWVCFKKKGGCGKKWPDGPHPADLAETLPVVDASQRGYHFTAAPKDWRSAEIAEQTRIERAKLLGRLRAATVMKKIGAEESRALWEKHCGQATPETVDIAALGSVLDAVTK